MEVKIAAAKINKYAVSESGDTLEVVERPGGGLSVVLADGQRSGKAAKRISSIVVRKVISLLAEGVRDGAAARAAADHLYNERKGQVSATLNILSVDLATNELLITCNNPSPVVIAAEGLVRTLEDDSNPIGVRRGTRPVIHQLQLEAGLTVVAYTDGLVHAGDRKGESLDIAGCLQELLYEENPKPSFIADYLMAQALELDEDRPIDDISIVVLRVTHQEGDGVRRMTVRLPFGP